MSHKIEAMKKWNDVRSIETTLELIKKGIGYKQSIVAGSIFGSVIASPEIAVFHPRGSKLSLQI